MRIQSLWGIVPLLLLLVAGENLAPSSAGAAVSTPRLKWQQGGCYSSWCETGWYSSPAVADLDHDGKMEVIGAAYSLFVLNGKDGSSRFTVKGPGGRVWPGVVVADLTGDGELEIVIAQGGGYVTVFDHTGKVLWTRQPITNELRGLSAYDLDGDGALEILVTGAVGSKVNTWVYSHDGELRSGWPQLSDESGYAWGVYNSNAAVYDLDRDGEGEIVVPSDVHYICAYKADGAPIPAHRMYGGKAWGAVGVWESLKTELRGWGSCTEGDPRSERFRTNFAHGPSVIADVDGNGSFEVVVTGDVYDCADPGYATQYKGVALFNRDRSRFNRGGFDWRRPPVDTGAPLSEDYNVIESAMSNPVVADLDGDHRKEILYASFDGRLHAFWLDKTEHGNWPYTVSRPSEAFYRFASEPVVADLDNDGCAEVLFTSWTQKGSRHTGKLHILDCRGNPLQEIDLPEPYGDADWNGALAAPTLADIDGDPDLEVVVNTAHSGLVAYDLPGSANARILWTTGRGNPQRTGSVSPRPLPVVTVTAKEKAVPENRTLKAGFRITRTGATDAPLVVHYTVGGGATGGSDYKKLPGLKTIPAGSTSAFVSLTPLDDSSKEKNEQVLFKLFANPSYLIGSPGSVGITLLDDD